MKGAGAGHRLRGWLVIIGLIAFMGVMMTLRIFVIGFAAGPLYGYVPVIVVGAMIVFMVARMAMMRRRHQHGGSGDQGKMPMMPMAAIVSTMLKKGGDKATPFNWVVYEASSKKGASDAVSSVSEELARAGLAVVGKIDMQKELKERTGGQISGFTIIDVFSPSEILRMTERGKDAGTPFPWRIVVQSNDSGTLVSLQAPPGYFERNPGSEEVVHKLERAIDAAVQA